MGDLESTDHGGEPMALTAPRQRFELPEPGPRRELQIDAGLIDLIVVGNELLAAANTDSRYESRLAAGAVKMGKANIPRPDRVSPPQSQIRVPVSGPRIERRGIGDRQRAPQARVVCRKGSLPEAGQHEEPEATPVTVKVEIDHGLAELVLAVDVLHGVVLVDDVDQVARLRDAPEHLVDPNDQVPPVADA